MAAGSISAGLTSVDIIVHAVETYGAYPQLGKDPLVLDSQIVMALQTLALERSGPQRARCG